MLVVGIFMRKNKIIFKIIHSVKNADKIVLSINSS